MNKSERLKAMVFLLLLPLLLSACAVSIAPSNTASTSTPDPAATTTSPHHPHNDDNFITIISPATDTVWHVGKTETITWTNSDPLNDATIDFSLEYFDPQQPCIINGETIIPDPESRGSVEIGTVKANAGSFTYTVPDNQTNYEMGDCVRVDMGEYPLSFGVTRTYFGDYFTIAQ